jgi:hypothetical protein
MIYAFSQVVAAAGTRVALKAARTPAAWARIKAIKTSGAANTGNIYVGGSDVTASLGYPLTPGQDVTLEACAGQSYIDLANVYIDAGTSADEVKVLYGVK